MTVTHAAISFASHSIDSGRASADTVRIQSSCRQARSLLDGLIAIVRLQAEGPRARRGVVDVCRLLHEATRRNTPLFLQKSLAFGVVTHAGGIALVDRGAVELVVDNLIATLAPRVRSGSHIWVEIDRQESQLVLRLSVEPHDGAIPATLGAQHGLALVVASRIVELLGGHLDVDESRGERAWRVRLPA